MKLLLLLTLSLPLAASADVDADLAILELESDDSQAMSDLSAAPIESIEVEQKEMSALEEKGYEVSTPQTGEDELAALEKREHQASEVPVSQVEESELAALKSTHSEPFPQPNDKADYRDPQEDWGQKVGGSAPFYQKL